MLAKVPAVIREVCRPVTPAEGDCESPQSVAQWCGCFGPGKPREVELAGLLLDPPLAMASFLTDARAIQVRLDAEAGAGK